MRLYFLRHGLAGDKSKWQGDDFDRPLTEEGQEKMVREAETIAKLDLALDVIVTSPLVRAYQTAELVARKLNLLDKLVKDDRLDPDFDWHRLAKILVDQSKANSLMLVGHEPSFSETIGYLIGGGHVECKKGSLALVELPDRTALHGNLIWLLPPKILAN